MGGIRVSLALALALVASLLGAQSVGAGAQHRAASNVDKQSLVSPTATEMLPVESRVVFQQRNVAGLDRLRVVAANGYGSYGTNGPITYVCVSAKVVLDDRRYRRETGCIDDFERDSADFVYRFDGVQWSATASAHVPTATETWTTDASGKGRDFEKGRPSSAKLELLWTGVGQEHNRPWISSSPCFLTVICARAGIERIRDAEIVGALELGGLEVGVELPRSSNGAMRWLLSI